MQSEALEKFKERTFISLKENSNNTKNICNTNKEFFSDNVSLYFEELNHFFSEYREEKISKVILKELKLSDIAKKIIETRK